MVAVTTTTTVVASSAEVSGATATPTSPFSSSVSNAAAVATTATAISDAAPVTVGDWRLELPVSQLTITLYIPTTSVGAVIGRRGTTIANIQKMAQTPNAPPVRVSVVGHHQHQQVVDQGGTTASAATFAPTKPSVDPYLSSSPLLSTMQLMDPATLATSDPLPTSAAAPSASGLSSVPFTYTPLDFSDLAWTPVVIRADPLAALTVAQKVEPLCGGSGGGGLQDVVIDVPVGRQRHASIVGKRGLTLLQTSADTRCRIWVPPKERKLDVLQLEGPLSNCLACLQVLSTILNKAPGSSSKDATINTVSSGSANDGSGKTSGTHHKYAHQAQMIVATLPSQTKLRSVGRKTETVIKKKKVNGSSCGNEEAAATATAGGVLWQLTILGSVAQVTNAQSILTKWAESQQAKKEGVGGGGEAVAFTTTAPPSPGGTPAALAAAASVSPGGGDGTSNHRRSGGSKSGGRGGGVRGGGGRGGGRGGRKGKSRGGGGGRGGAPSKSSPTTE